MSKKAVLQAIAPYLSIIGVAVITYLPALNNFFISDDFGMLTYVHYLRQSPLLILNAPSEFFRLTSYVYFSACVRLFGLDPVAFYWSGITLHVVVSLLVYFLVLKATRERMAAWAAAIFFAAYERHQEAVMWISAANSTIVTLFCLLFLILWLRSTYKTRALALAVLIAALFSKESAVTLAPLSVLISVLNGKSWRSALRETVIVLTITAGYIGLWLSYSRGNAFVSHHYYAFSLHFVPVYARALLRLTAVALPFGVAILIASRRSAISLLYRDRHLILFFAAIMALALVPVSFLTYQNNLPSRSTYYPSVGLCAIVGMLFFRWHSALVLRKAGHLALFFLMIVIAANVAYVWMKKDSQYVERAAPTRQLILELNDIAPRLGTDKSVCVEGFPLDAWSGSEAVRWFTSVPLDDVSFSTPCEVTPHVFILRWNQTEGLTFVRGNSAGTLPGNSPVF